MQIGFSFSFVAFKLFRKVFTSKPCPVLGQWLVDWPSCSSHRLFGKKIHGRARTENDATKTCY